MGFLLVGLGLLSRWRRDPWLARAWGPLALATFVGSTAFHATSSYLGMMLDYSSMVLQAAFVVTVGLARWRGGTLTQLGVVYACLVTGGVLLNVASGSSENVGFIGLIVVFVAIEARLAWRDRSTRYAPLAGVVALFVVSWSVWWLDRLRVTCNPDNHVFNGHALWHLLGAASFPLWYLFYRQPALSRSGALARPRAA